MSNLSLSPSRSSIAALHPAERSWVLIVLIGSLLHLLRDVLQEAGIRTWISTIAVKSGPLPTAWIWHHYNTLFIELFLIGAALVVLRRSYFGRLGWITVAVVLSTLIGFVYYWAWA